jgi:hypothetical protein
VPNLHAFDPLGNFIGKRTRPCAELYSAMADLLADRFGCEVDRIDFDNRADGATYVTVDGQVRGYVLTIDWDGGWHEAIPAGGHRAIYHCRCGAARTNPPPVRLPHNDNAERFTADLALVARVMAGSVSL